MASLEPPIPSNVAGNFDGAMAEAPADHREGWSMKGRFGKAGKRTVGLLMLAIVVFLWTASNFLASVSFPIQSDAGLDLRPVQGLTTIMQRRTSWPTTSTASPSSSRTSTQHSLSSR